MTPERRSLLDLAENLAREFFADDDMPSTMPVYLQKAISVSAPRYAEGFGHVLLAFLKESQPQNAACRRTTLPHTPPETCETWH